MDNIINTTDKNLFEYLKNNKSIPALTASDKIFKHYITLKYKDDVLNIPFNYIFESSTNKLKCIYINHTTSKKCPSRKHCNINKLGLCYSCIDESIHKGSLNKHKINALVINESHYNKNLFESIINYINSSDIDLIRFNKDGDFKNVFDYKFICELAALTPLKIYGGYTKNKQVIEYYKNNKGVKNLKLNISGVDYNYTTDLKTYLTSSNKCRGNCNKCMGCYTSSKPHITLLHASLSRIDKYYNTVDNRDFLIKFFNHLDIKLTHELLQVNKGLLSSLNKVLKKYDLKIKNYNELIQIIETKNKI